MSPPNILGGWQTGGTFEYQPGALLDLGQHVFFNGNLDDIAKDNPEIALQRDGTIDSRSPGSTRTRASSSGRAAAGAVPEAQLPVPCRRRAWPRVVPGEHELVRNFRIGGGRSLQFRLDVQNLFDAVLWSNPDLDPTSTNFGKVTGATNSIMRFFTFVWKVNF